MEEDRRHCAHRKPAALAVNSSPRGPEAEGGKGPQVPEIGRAHV